MGTTELKHPETIQRATNNGSLRAVPKRKITENTHKSRPRKQNLCVMVFIEKSRILQVLKKTMLDEKLLSIIEKAGESGQLSWSALTTTIIMTCVLIIHGMARWEPCRAILQQMGIIEHLQVIKFKNSRDLACKELNDSSDNEDNGNGKITEVF